MYAYVEWFAKPPKSPHPDMQMYAVKPLYDSRTGKREGGIVELDAIVQPCYLLPVFPNGASRELGRLKNGGYIEINGDNCLDVVQNFWINSFQDQATYQTVF